MKQGVGASCVSEWCMIRVVGSCRVGAEVGCDAGIRGSELAVGKWV